MSVDTGALLSRLDEIDQISNAEWLASLAPRHKAELDFHNHYRETAAETEAKAQDTYEKIYGNKKYYAAVDRSVAYVHNWIARNAQGRVVLDYACGNGNLALKAAEAGAALAIGLDISDVSVANARAEAKRRGLTNTRFIQANAEDTRLPDESIDLVLCAGMLHHLDLSYAFPELRRVMRVGAKLLAVEALDYNPAIKLYRMLTPAMRTDWEKAHILSLKDLRFARRFFDVGEVKFWHVSSWIGGKVRPLLSILNRADVVLDRIPILRLWAWIWTFELIRPEKH